MEEQKIDSVADFLKLLNKRNKRWCNNPSKQNYWIYRGQWENNPLTLQPKSLRPNLGLPSDQIKNELSEAKLSNSSNIDLFSKSMSADYKNANIELFNTTPRSFTEVEVNRLEVILKQSMLELRLIKNFIETCNKSALYIESTKINIKNMGNGKTSEADEFILLLHDFVKNWLKANLDMEIMRRVKNYSPLFEYETYHPIALAQHHYCNGRPSR